MDNFIQIDSNVNFSQIVDEINFHPDLWDVDKLRQSFPGTPHKDTRSIILRFNDTEDLEGVVDDMECYWRMEAYELPKTLSLVYDFARATRADRIGRVMFTELPAGGVVEPHEDMGAPAHYYERFHIVVQADPGVVFQTGEEKVEMVSGDVWWFNNEETHSIINSSETTRIHLIIDLKTDLYGD